VRSLSTGLQQIAAHIEPTLVLLEAAEEQPPSAADAWFLHTNKMPASTDQLQLQVLDELRVARFDRELADAGPERVHDRYRLALMNPHDQENASLIRYVERRHGGGWAWKPPAQDEGTAAQALRDRIKATRHARRPEAAIKARAAWHGAEYAVEQAIKRTIGRHAVEKRVTSTWKDLVA